MGTNPTAATLQAQVQRLEDIEEIRGLLVEYGRTLDRRDFAACAQLFGAAGAWVGEMDVGSAKGPARVRAMLEKNIGAAPRREPTAAHHIMTNMAIDVDGDSATAWSRWLFVTASPDGKPVPVLSGHYDDVLMREDGCWKFHQRIVFCDIPLGQR